MTQIPRKRGESPNAGPQHRLQLSFRSLDALQTHKRQPAIARCTSSQIAVTSSQKHRPFKPQQAPGEPYGEELTGAELSALKLAFKKAVEMHLRHQIPIQGNGQPAATSCSG